MPELQIEEGGDALLLHLRGDWCLRDGIASTARIEQRLDSSGGVNTLAYVTDHLGAWDSGLLAFLVRVADVVRARGLSDDRSGLPAGVQGMLRLAEAVPETSAGEETDLPHPGMTRVGLTAIELHRSAWAMLGFLGETTLAFGRALVGRASFRRADLMLAIQQAGVEAMPIVALVSLLMGVILAFVGAIQLSQFGAAIYVADLVGIAMVRDMGALMTGIVMAGRSGAAYAAEIGSMQVNEEVDALRSQGISPVEFLVLPRVIALVLMMPLLTLYSDFVSIVGGMLIGVSLLDQTFTAYTLQTVGALNLTHLSLGIIKAFTYGALVALSGCLRGMQSGRSSLAVGAAATSAVVTAIVLMITAAGIFSYISYVLGI